jgi:Tfp pilus assembly protein FimV
MKTPTEYDIERLVHLGYDPVKAHEYYMRNRKLKGRKKGSSQDPRTGKTRPQIHKDAKARQRKELSAAINNLERKLQKLEALIKKKLHAEASENRKGKAKKERAAKEKDKPKSAAEKAKASRENEKYRKKNQQKLKTKAKGKSGGGSSKGSKTGGASKHSVTELKSLATKVRGQIQVAKQKLAAL